jgi:sugar/nucleoside kinase (ribokinase family)
MALVAPHGSAIIAAVPPSPIDYLVVGHIAKDLNPQGHALGGTAAYAGLTAAAFGLKVGAVTSMGSDFGMSRLGDVLIHRLQAPETTTFLNQYSAQGRTQTIRARALPLDLNSVPAHWRSPTFVHLGPIADEVDLQLATAFPQSFLGLTPQGWFRRWDEKGVVSLVSWEVAAEALPRADAVVISMEDVGGDEKAVGKMAERCRVLVVTDGAHGARIYTQGTMRLVPAPSITVVDVTGAGDVFAAAFFIRFKEMGDAREAARLANEVASTSATRPGLRGTPTAAEVRALLASRPK